jgi:hypothetical protein
MVSRIVGRIVTGPAAFFVAWVLDISAYAAHSFRRRLQRR